MQNFAISSSWNVLGGQKPEANVHFHRHLNIADGDSAHTEKKKSLHS